jgi:hypothetical protein
MLPNRCAMFGNRKNLCGLWVLVGMTALPAAAFAQPRVAVVETVQTISRLKLSVRQAVASALDDLLVSMVPPEDLTIEDAACTDAACYAAMAKRTNATYVLLVQGVANPAGYRLSLDMRDGETGRSLGTDNKDCELCAENQFAPTIKDRVTRLGARVMKESESSAQAGAPVAATAPAKRPGVDVSSIPPWWVQPRPMIGLGLGVAGLAAVGIGIYYIAVDGNVATSSSAGSHPGILVRDTSKWGWTLVGVGGVAALAGTSMFIWGRDDGTQVEVVMGPASLGLHGKF